MPQSDALKRAKTKWDSKHDKITVRLPKGLREQLQAVLNDNESVNSFLVKCIEDKIKKEQG